MHIMGAEGALEGDRRKVFQAIGARSVDRAVCSLDEIQAMTAPP